MHNCTSDKKGLKNTTKTSSAEKRRRMGCCSTHVWKENRAKREKKGN